MSIRFGRNLVYRKFAVLTQDVSSVSLVTNKKLVCELGKCCERSSSVKSVSPFQLLGEPSVEKAAVA